MNVIEPTFKWAASPGTRRRTTHIVTHHAAASSATVEQIHSWHLARGWAGIGYHYYVRKDGKIYRGRPENWVGAHTTGYNSTSIGICFEGNFETEKMPAAQLAAGARLIDDIQLRRSGLTLRRHRELAATACPGANFPWEDLLVFCDEEDKEDEEMTLDTFTGLMNEYLAAQTKKSPGTWSKAARSWAESEGILEGEGDGIMAYKRYLTREECVQILYNLAKKSEGK